VAIAPSTSTTIYAAGTNGVYKSIDGGTSWHAINHGLENQNGPINILALTIDPTNPNIVYAAGPDITDPSVTYKAIYETIDGGASWSITKYSIRSFAVHHALAIDPTNTNVIYAGGSVGWGTVWKSTDGGYFWTIVDVGPDFRSTVLALTIDPTNTSVIYAGTAGQGVLRSTDGGATWSEFNDGLPVYSTDENGKRYFYAVSSVVIDPADPRVIYAGTSGVFKSRNGGSWTPLNGGLTNLYINALAISSTNPNTICAATYNGILKTINSGASWNAYNRGLRGASINALAVNPGNGNLYAGTYDGTTFKSTDNGGSWSPTNFYPLAFDPHNPNTIYARRDGQEGLFQSANAGASWTSVSAGAPNAYASFVLIDPNDPNVAYAATDAFYKSTDAGETWKRVADDPYFYASLLVIDPTNSQTLYATYDDGNTATVYKSVDGGTTWKISAGTEKSFLYYVSTLAIDPKNSPTLYALACATDTDPCGIYKSTDSGENWTRTAAQVPNDDISSLILDPAQPNAIYVGTYGHGVFKSSDGGASLNPFNDGFTDLNINALAIDAAGNFLHAGTLAGAFDLQLAVIPINQIDDAQFFVRQHYRDFLNREADTDGLNFWTGSIFSCGGDSSCIGARKVSISAAFFLSIEFQQTGYEVYRFYKAAYGNLPNLPVPIKFDEFVPDTQKISQGVIVNQSGWEQVLEKNKQVFAAEYVQRSRFTSGYPLSMTPGAFVDRLFTNAGVVPAPADRATVINEFGSAATTADSMARARALRRVAEDSALVQQEFNRAFVLMQYFGYLRRNPNDPPEATLDFQGYNFWLTKLNHFNGSFAQAEMVKAFLSSTEYRQRFGP
jgi:photosystem II stability/assembly factor-like uncharacterized protein